MKILDIIDPRPLAIQESTLIEGPVSDYLERYLGRFFGKGTNLAAKAGVKMSEKEAQQIVKQIASKYAKDPVKLKLLEDYSTEYSDFMLKSIKEQGPQFTPSSIQRLFKSKYPGNKLGNDLDFLEDLQALGDAKWSLRIEQEAAAAEKATGADKTDDKKKSKYTSADKVVDDASKQGFFKKFFHVPNRGYIANAANLGAMGYTAIEIWKQYDDEQKTNQLNQNMMLKELTEKTVEWANNGQQGPAPSIKFDYKDSAFPPAPAHPKVYKGTEHDYTTEAERLQCYTTYMNDEARRKAMIRLTQGIAAYFTGEFLLKGAVKFFGWRNFKGLLGKWAAPLETQHPGFNSTMMARIEELLSRYPTFEKYKQGVGEKLWHGMSLAEVSMIYNFVSDMSSDKAAQEWAGIIWDNIEGISTGAKQVGLRLLNATYDDFYYAALPVTWSITGISNAFKYLDDLYMKYGATPIIATPEPNTQTAPNTPNTAVDATDSTAPSTNQQPTSVQKTAKPNADDDYVENDNLGADGNPVSKTNPPKGDGWQLNDSGTAWTKPGYYKSIPRQ